MHNKKSKILITGVAGFIGSNLAERLLAAGYEVRGIDNLAYGIESQVPKVIEFYKTDIRSEEIYPLFKNIDVVFHLAAKNDLRACAADPVETVDINIRGTANVFEAARLGSVKKVVYASSSAVEEGEKRLNGMYAMSKATGERIAASYREGFGLASVCLRYFNVYGPRQDYRRASPPVISKFIISILKGERPILFANDDRNKRDFIYIDDVNDFHIICLQNNKADNLMFRLASGRSTSIKELFETVKKVMNSKIDPRIQNPQLNSDVPIEPVADISAAQGFGWNPKMKLEDGLKTMVDFLKNEMKIGRLR